MAQEELIKLETVTNCNALKLTAADGKQRLTDALNLAQNGYSVKNLPDTENRGYGISSNYMIT